MSAVESPPTHLWTRQDMPEPASLRLRGGGEAAVFSGRAPGKSTECEDAAVLLEVDDKRAVFAVADGLGGHANGAEAASTALTVLTEHVHEVHPTDEPTLRSAILNGVERANQSICERGGGAGTTLAIVELDGSVIRPYHVGDSVILTVGQRGKLKMQTVAHSPVGYAVEAGLLDAQEAIHHSERHLVSNIVGTPVMRIEIGPPLDLARRDTLLLASDGLFDNLHTEEIIATIRKGPLITAARRLVDLSRQRMTSHEPGQPSKPDDLTFLLYRRSA